MAKIKVSYTAPGADVVTAKVNTTPVTFTGTAKAGQSEFTLSAGNYRLNYTVEGLPNTAYTFKIEGASPDVTLSDTIGPTGLAAGAIPFKVATALAMAKAASVTAAAIAIGVAAGARTASKKKAAAAKKRSASKKRTTSAKKGRASTAKRGTSAKTRTSAKKVSSRKSTARKSSKKGGRR